MILSASGTNYRKENSCDCDRAPGRPQKTVHGPGVSPDVHRFGFKSRQGDHVANVSGGHVFEHAGVLPVHTETF